MLEKSRCDKKANKMLKKTKKKVWIEDIFEI